MKRALKSALIMAVGASIYTASAQGKTIEKVVAVVNDEIVLDTELEQWALPQMRGPVDLESAEGKKNWEAHKRKILEQLVDSRLVLQQATELKLSVTPDEVDRAAEEVKHQNKLDDAGFAEALKQQGFTLDGYRKNLRKQILELKVINTAVRSRVSVSDDEIKAYYQQNARQLGGDKTTHLKQILVEVPSGAAEADVERQKRTATRVLELAHTGSSFDELAKTYSDDASTKADGGDLGWVGHGVLADPLEEVVDSMDAGDVRGPIRTSRGFVVLKLLERKIGDVRPLEEVKEQLRKQLYDQQVEKATQSWTKELRRKAHVDLRL